MSNEIISSAVKRLKTVSVENLLGRFSHTVSFGAKQDIVIVTAPNGYGKTAFLRILNHFLNGQFRRLSAYQFSSISILFNDHSSILITKHEDQRGSLGKANIETNLNPITISYSENEVLIENWRYDIALSGSKPSQLNMIDRLIPQLDRVGPTSWYDGMNEEIIELEEVFERYGDRLPESFEVPKTPQWLQLIIKDTNCRLIETQRLMAIETTEYIEHRYRRSSEPSTYVVEKQAKDLAKQIEGKQKEYATTSQGLDQTFPHRILAKVTNRFDPIDELTLRERIQQLEQRRRELVEAGLIKQMQELPALSDETISDDVKIVLNLYTEDTRKKLALFDDLNSKISSFKQILNEKYRFKKIAVNQTSGIIVTTEDGIEIPLNSLSSGEQHELVLLYELLFSTTPNSIVLIDEPEISLHVAWQKRFLPDLERIIGSNSFQAIVATHSPQIINDRWDLTVEFKPPQD